MAKRRSFAGFVFAGLLTLAVAAPALAQPPVTVQRGGAAGLVAVVAQVAATVDVETIDVDVLNNSLNNLLRNADIDVLNNVLNNTLRNADIRLVDVVDIEGNVIAINVLSGETLTGILDLS